MADIDHLPVQIVHFGYGLICRSHHLHRAICGQSVQVFFQILHSHLQVRLILPNAMDGKQSLHRRISHQLPVQNLLAVKCLIILFRRSLNTVIIRLISLNHHSSLLLSSSGSPGRLGKKLKSTLSCRVIVHMEGQISCHYPHQCYIWKIMPFYNHLCSHQDVRLLIGKGCKNLHMPVLLSGGIRIHPQNTSFRKNALYLLAHLLGTHLKTPDKRRTTLGTYRWIGSRITTVMADKPLCLRSLSVESKRYITVGTAGHISAGPTCHKTCIPSPVQKQHHLLISIQTLLHPLHKSAA